MNTTKYIAAFVALVWAGASFGQNLAPIEPRNVVQLSSTGSVEVQQDLLTLNLTATREGADAVTVQTQLKQALDTALAEARRAAVPGQMDVRTGNFSLNPRWGRDGKTNGWMGTAELILEGRDFARITQTAGKIQTMVMGGVGFGLSREQRAKVETDAQTLAIERFKLRAGELARGFGFTSYTLREVSVSGNEPVYAPRVQRMSMEAKAASADMAVPVEAGKSTVSVTVSGSVQMR